MWYMKCNKIHQRWNRADSKDSSVILNRFSSYTDYFKPERKTEKVIKFEKIRMFLSIAN